MSTVIHQTREQWLATALDEARPVVESLTGEFLARRIRVGVGFPSTFRRSGTLAECWPDVDSGDATAEVIISPTIADPVEVFARLLGQIIRTLPGAMSPASVSYRAAFDAVMLTGGADKNALLYSAEFYDQWEQIVASLGDYPHAELSTGVKKTQSTRMLKMVCPQCGYILRTTEKWIKQGIPVCHDGALFTVEGAEEVLS